MLLGLVHEVIKQVCVGNANTIFLTATNRVYVTGSNQFGQLGVPCSVLPEEKNIALLDTSFLGGELIKQIDTGIAGGTSLLTETGSVWSAGESW